MVRASTIAIAMLCVACSGGASFTNGVYRDSEARYRVGELDSGWERMDMDDNDLAWHSPRHGAVVQVNATCDPGNDVPLSALTNHLLIGFTQREFRSSDTVQIDGRDALRSHVIARLDGVPRELLLYVLKKDDCTYDFALIAPNDERYQQAESEFERMVRGFTTVVEGT